MLLETKGKVLGVLLPLLLLRFTLLLCRRGSRL